MASPTERPCWRPLATHLHVALTVRTNGSGRRALHTQLGQEPHYLEREMYSPMEDRQLSQGFCGHF